ncbi:MAG: hypothetical protein K6A40_02810 [Solobacterium sp.]|nr:hypothetical protein [Solobacterium sp.]
MNWVLFMIMSMCGILFTGLGIYALKRKEPMWFYSGTPVSKENITDVRAYNRANGIMWIVFSLLFWLTALFVAVGWRGYFLMIAMIPACICLPFAYERILNKYRKNS